MLMAADPDGHLSVVSRFDNVGSAYLLAGKVRIELREIRVEAISPYGKPVPERITVIFEPKSKAFSWNIFEEDSLATNKSRKC